MSFIRLPRTLGNTSGLPSPSGRAASRISSARALSGTRCSRFALVRVAGTVPTWAAVSISARSAPRTSPDLAAVNTRNSNASLMTGAAPDAPTVPTTAATSRCGSARMCWTRSRCGPRIGPIRWHGLSSR